jgi:hypothetical protein
MQLSFFLSFDSYLPALQLRESEQMKFNIERAELSSVSGKTQDRSNVFHVSCVRLETTNKLSEAFPDALDSKMVIRYDDIKWFTPYITGP